MTNKKILIIILICVLIIILSALSIFYLIRGIRPSKESDIILTDEQYQLVRDSVFHMEFEEMNNVQIRNAWQLLMAMEEIGFVENRQPGQSGVAGATRILDALGIEEVGTIDNMWIEEGINDNVRTFVAIITSKDNEVYYISYNQILGLQMVRKEGESGEVLYSAATHYIVDGEIHIRAGFENMWNPPHLSQ